MHYLGKNLRHLRKQLSKTQSEIAKLIKKGQTTIGNWENGISEPNIDELLIISNFFDIPIDALLRTDLSEAHAHYRQAGTPVPYDASAEPSSFVRDRDDKLTFVLEEIRQLREEMERLHARIPEK
jgi:transcriptional regulator with XRE-family HTH domain